jgi:hypothetical protein
MHDITNAGMRFIGISSLARLELASNKRSVIEDFMAQVWGCASNANVTPALRFCNVRIECHVDMKHRRPTAILNIGWDSATYNRELALRPAPAIGGSLGCGPDGAPLLRCYP